MFRSMDELRKHMGPDTSVLDDGSGRRKEPRQKAKRPRVAWTDEEKRVARAVFQEEATLWLKARAIVYGRDGSDYVAFAGALKSGGYVLHKTSWEPAESPDTGWTGAERDFYFTYLYPLLQAGALDIVIAQAPIYMPGQRVTVDFVGFDHQGIAHHYEVKGKYKLGSESRASVKYRWLRYYLDNIKSPHLVYWAKDAGSGDFRVREIVLSETRNPLMTAVRSKR